MNLKERSWAFYDWANSAYTIIIVTAVFPLYFKNSATLAGIDAATSTAYLGYANSIGSLIVSLLAPLLGTIADFKGYKKRFFMFFVGLGVLFTLLLAIIPVSQWFVLLLFYVITSVGFYGANVFYDAFIVDVTTKERMNKISANGFAYGYVGSCIPFIFVIALILLATNDVLTISTTLATQIGFGITGLWWGLFTIPMLKNVEQVYYTEKVKNPVLSSFSQLWKTVKNIRDYKIVFTFLLAYFFYIDGVHTIIKMSTSYGSDLGIGSSTLLIVLFVTQIVAAPAAYFFGKLGDKYSEKTMLLIGIGIYTIICIYAYFMTSALDFWILALAVGMVQGGIQALSRSYFAKIIPKEKSNEFFGFYNIFGKFAAIMGPLLLGIVAQLTGSSNAGVLSLVVLFIIGGFILLKLPKEINN